MAATTRFLITFDAAYARLSRALFISPSGTRTSRSRGTTSRCDMSWAFRATFDRSQVVKASPLGTRVPLTRGVHGWAGRWLVNGAGDGILTVDLEPAQRAHVMGFPVRLRQLQVSVEDPAALARALAP